MVKLHRIHSGFYIFFLPGDNEGDPAKEFHIEPASPFNESGYLWSVYDDGQNTYLASYQSLSDIRTSF